MTFQEASEIYLKDAMKAAGWTTPKCNYCHNGLVFNNMLQEDVNCSSCNGTGKDWIRTQPEKTDLNTSDFEAAENQARENVLRETSATEKMFFGPTKIEGTIKLSEFPNKVLAQDPVSTTYCPFKITHPNFGELYFKDEQWWLNDSKLRQPSAVRILTDILCLMERDWKTKNNQTH